VNKKIMGLAMVLSLLLLIGVVSAYRGDPLVLGPNYSQERHEAMNQAFVNANYSTWFELMTSTNRSPRVLKVVNENNFDSFIKARALLSEGKVEEANSIREELGLNNGQGQKRNENKSNRGQRGNKNNCPYSN